jgi:DNA-binding CsgD family transcriptional regulator
MNPFTDIGRPIVDRPGDAVEPLPAPKRLLPPPLFLPQVETPWGLTPMECEVLRRVVLGEQSKEIGAALGRSHKTVDVHCERLKKKMGVRSLLQAALLWDRHFRANQVSLTPAEPDLQPV